MTQDKSNNQNSDISDVSRWLDPDFWREQGIEPIVINPNDKDAPQQIADEFSKAIEKIFGTGEGDKKDGE